MKCKIVTLSDVSINGGSYGIAASAVPYSKNLPTYLRITDIKDDGTINFDDLKSVADSNASKYYLAPNDIVFARTGASTGRNYFYDGTDRSFVYAGFLIKFSIDPKKVNPLIGKKKKQPAPVCGVWSRNCLKGTNTRRKAWKTQSPL